MTLFRASTRFDPLRVLKHHLIAQGEVEECEASTRFDPLRVLKHRVISRFKTSRISFNAIRPAEGIETEMILGQPHSLLSASTRFDPLRVLKHDPLEAIWDDDICFNAIRPAEGIETFNVMPHGIVHEELQRDSTR